MKNSKSNLDPKDYEKVGRLIEEVVATGYSKPGRLLWYSFIRGIAYGLGIFIAGTVIVGLVVWGLSFFDQVPGVNHIINSLNTYQ